MAANTATHRFCAVPNCTKYRQGGTLFCISHGGGRRCQHPGCLKSVYGTLTSRFCCAHGGGPRCQVPGCNKGSRGKKTGLCFKHGGGLSQRCRAPNCKKARLRRKFFCGEHSHLEQIETALTTTAAQSPNRASSGASNNTSSLESCLSVLSRSTDTSSPSRVGDRISQLTSVAASLPFRGAHVSGYSVKALGIGDCYVKEHNITDQWPRSCYEIGLALLNGY